MAFIGQDGKAIQLTILENIEIKFCYDKLDRCLVLNSYGTFQIRLNKGDLGGKRLKINIKL